jgi:CheY-like chemotaxis protein
LERDDWPSLERVCLEWHPMSRRWHALCLRHPEMEHLESRPAWTPAPHQTRRLIVLADDDDELRSLFAMALETEGYVVVQCDDGVELVQAVMSTLDQSVAPTLGAVVADVRMPHLDGLCALELLRCATRDVPFFLMTGSYDERLNAEAGRVNARLLYKPIELTQLRHAVTNAMGGIDAKCS